MKELIMRLFVAVSIMTLAGSTLAAQNPSEEQLKRQAEEMKGYAFVTRERVPLEKVVKGAPYSAELVKESSQALADGNRINQRSTGRVYRDSEGRTRREEDLSNSSVAISIFDPVAGVSYSLDPDTRTAWKTPTQATEEIIKKLEAAQKEERLRAEEERRRAAGEPNAEAPSPAELEARRKREAETAAAQVAVARVARGAAPEDQKEGPLERKTLEGVTVEGRRNTRTIRAGAIGNDLPITITWEEWSSPDLKVLVMTHRNDPRSGESSYKLTNIVRAEPDRSLFQVPADYTIKETGIRKNFEQH
jgi:hypothetical protein